MGVFFTWTAPSRFHAWKTGRNGKTIENDKYQGATPAKPAPIWPSSGPDPRLTQAQ